MKDQNMSHWLVQSCGLGQEDGAMPQYQKNKNLHHKSHHHVSDILYVTSKSE